MTNKNPSQTFLTENFFQNHFWKKPVSKIRQEPWTVESTDKRNLLTVFPKQINEIFYDLICVDFPPYKFNVTTTVLIPSIDSY